jgi:hypothetical protein
VPQNDADDATKQAIAELQSNENLTRIGISEFELYDQEFILATLDKIILEQSEKEQQATNGHAANPSVPAAGQKILDYQRGTERHRWKIAPIALAILFYVAWIAAWILMFAFRRQLSALPLIREHWAITLLGFIALVTVPTFYFAVRADFRQNEAIRAGCGECFDQRVEYLIKELRFSREAALAAAQQVADGEEPPRWMTALFGQSRTFRSLTAYHLLHSAAFGSFFWPAALVSLGSPLRKSIMRMKNKMDKRPS